MSRLQSDPREASPLTFLKVTEVKSGVGPLFHLHQSCGIDPMRVQR
jgi:hypothetical protein